MSKEHDDLRALAEKATPGVPTLLDEIKRLQTEIDRCHARLEIDHEYRMGDNDDSDLERVEVPIEHRAGQIDGIECRDATIAELERQVEASRERADNLHADLEKVRAIVKPAGLGTPLRQSETDAAWFQVVKLFQQHGMAVPPVRLRDTIVVALCWAWYGESVFRALIEGKEG